MQKLYENLKSFQFRGSYSQKLFAEMRFFFHKDYTCSYVIDLASKGDLASFTFIHFPQGYDSKLKDCFSFHTEYIGPAGL